MIGQRARNFIAMSESSSRVLDGVFAIHKPGSITSNDVLNHLKKQFNPSELFSPLLASQKAFRDWEQSKGQRVRKKHRKQEVKMGHGGTLDPMATGVLVVGVGKGTKRMPDFLKCTKSYDATFVFGAATDTYDVMGKVLRRAPYDHLNRQKIEDALDSFRGKIMQRPPLFSALRMDGKKLYEYAREGKPIPREIEKRPVEVKALEILEWLDGGKHDQIIPKEDASKESKDLAEQVLHLNEVVSASEQSKAPAAPSDPKVTAGTKRKRSPHSFSDTNSINDEDLVVYDVQPRRSTSPPSSPDETYLMSGALQTPSQSPEPEPEPETEPQSPNPSNAPAEPSSTSPPPPTEPTPPPALRVRMTVTSGFYVRSLAHDLGEAVGSLACMSALVRTRQAGFELGQNVLEYEDLQRGEGVWGPRVKELLEEWERRGGEGGGEAVEEGDEGGSGGG